MVINENNSQINSFTKGMNSDTSYDQIENTQYVFGQNLRITKNQPLGGNADYASVHEGIVAPVPLGSVTQWYQIQNPGKILSIKSVENTVVMVLNPWSTKDIAVYKFELDPETNQFVPGHDYPKIIWKAQNVWTGDVPAKVSAVLYKELDNVVKLYIATGEHPILTLRVDGDDFSTQVDKSIDYLINNRIVPKERIYIKEVITGRLLTSQVQYTYRYYNKYGNSTQLAPLTNKIQVIDSSRAKEIGNAENTETAIGFMLSINTEEYNSKFDRIQVFRLQYIKPGEDAEVSLIYDDKIGDQNEFILNDVGIDPLQSYNMEEFSAMQGLILIPQTIEQNQEYMFCSNVKDDTIIQGLNVAANDNNVSLVRTSVVLDDKRASTQLNIGHIPTITTDKFSTANDNNPVKILNNSDGTAVMDVDDYLKQRGVNADNVTATYNNIFTSSLLRSLRRGEKYKYAIIFYDKYGRRSDVQPLTANDVEVPAVDSNNKYFRRYENTGKIEAIPVGVKVKLPTLTGQYVTDGNLKDIIGCQIVRRNSSEIYQNALLQVALARPIQQGLLDVNISDPSLITEDTVKKSPFYPTGLLTTQDFKISPSYYDEDKQAKDAVLAKTKNSKLFQAFSSEIDFRRDDVLSKLSYSDLKIHPVLSIDGIYGCYKNSTYDSRNIFSPNASGGQPVVEISTTGTTVWRKRAWKMKTDEKQAVHWIFDYCIQNALNNASERSIKQVKDVKMADWNSAFSDVVFQEGDGTDVYTAIKKYRSYTTNIDSYLYNNWVSFCKYDLRAGIEDQPNMDWDADEAQEFLATQEDYKYWIDHNESSQLVRNGYIGPGPSCFLVSTEDDLGQSNGNARLRTMICNITHTPKMSNVQSAQTEQYFGFGNYFSLEYDETEHKLKVVDAKDDDKQEMVVFDGDIYITPHEITTQFKCYDFQSIDTLQSTQITNYIPLESKVNTYFDYGMNLRNTNSENLLYEPGSIDGVTTQERPLHQYNMIYSDNDASNDVFTLISTDKDETNNFKQRAYYSELKTNGEFIDNFLIFKAASFIDVDSRYGQITELVTDKNTLYYWQDHAFGKFSVNERSLVNDQNSNTIMLGQAGILSRYDYLSTKYGMRLQDMCARVTDNGLFWVDINNRAVVGLLGGQVVNYGERTGVQNIINGKITTDVPDVDYDLQNDELICRCLGSEQLIFNLKYNIATATYTRMYNSMFYVKNHLYSILIINKDVFIQPCNYLEHSEGSYLYPMHIEFIVNPSASITKVFDSQQIVPINLSNNPTEYLDDVQMSFKTDVYERQDFDIQSSYYTTREGNIIYNIPRYNNQEYGSRIRGKWMKVDITKDSPTDLFTISHVITKFRQSYS